jgi:hypothetical protein
MGIKKNTSERFCEHVFQHVLGGYVEDFKSALPNALANKVISCMNVFCASVVFGVLGKSFGSLVIDVKRQCPFWTKVELAQDVSQPDGLLAGVQHGSLVFGFGARETYRGLFPRFP